MKWRISRVLPAVMAMTMISGILAADTPRVFTVDNTGGPHAHFTDLQVAVDAALDGDILHVLGSPILYGNVIITRRVHLFGPGYNLARVYTEGYQDFHEATLGTVQFEPSLTSSAAGSTLSGFRTGGISIAVSDVTIQRNRTGAISVHTVFVDAQIIEQPHRARILQNYAFMLSATAPQATGHLIANNIFTSTGSSAVISNGTVRHNFMTRGSSNVPYFQNCVVENNFLGGVHRNSRNSLLRNNLIETAMPDSVFFPDFYSENSLIDNQWTLQTDDVWPTLITGSGAFDEAYQLAETSLAKGAGFGGVDVGPYAGPFPYEISGVPPMPRVKIMAPGPFTASPNSDLTIPVKIVLP